MEHFEYVYSHQLSQAENIMEAEDIVSVFYELNLRKLNFEVREFYLHRYIHSKFIHSLPEGMEMKFDETVKYFTKLFCVIFEDNWKLKKSIFLNIFELLETVFRRGHDDATIVRIMFHYTENKFSLGSKLKGKHND